MLKQSRFSQAENIFLQRDSAVSSYQQLQTLVLKSYLDAIAQHSSHLVLLLSTEAKS